jgi:hypothetical protein
VISGPPHQDGEVEKWGGGLTRKPEMSRLDLGSTTRRQPKLASAGTLPALVAVCLLTSFELSQKTPFPI